MRNRLAAVSALALAFVAVSTGSAHAQVGAGSIKVDNVDFDDHQDNQPHDACDFEIDFYGYPEGDYDAVVTFTAVEPTGTSVILAEAGDQTPAFSASGVGGALNGGEAYQLDLDAYTPAGLGYHIDVNVVVTSEGG